MEEEFDGWTAGCMMTGEEGEEGGEEFHSFMFLTKNFTEKIGRFYNAHQMVQRATFYGSYLWNRVIVK